MESSELTVSDDSGLGLTTPERPTGWGLSHTLSDPAWGWGKGLELEIGPKASDSVTTAHVVESQGDAGHQRAGSGERSWVALLSEDCRLSAPEECRDPEDAGNF